MESTSRKKKWYNLRLLALLIIAIAIFVKYFVLEKKEENKTVLVTELDLDYIALKSAAEVEAVLGKGKVESYYKDEKAGCEQCPKVSYKGGKVQVIYINNIADKIMLKDLADFEFQDKAILGVLNFDDDSKPTFEDRTMKRWNNYKKYSQIAAFPKEGRLNYILINCKQH